MRSTWAYAAIICVLGGEAAYERLENDALWS